MDNFDNVPSSSTSETRSRIFRLPLSSILEKTDSGVFITDTAYNIVWLNDEVFDATFNAPEVKSFILNKPITFFVNYIQELIIGPQEFLDWTKNMLEKQQPVYGKEIHLKSGESLIFSNIPILYEGDFFGVIWQVRKRAAHRTTIPAATQSYRSEFYDISKKFNIKCCRINNYGDIISASPAFTAFSGYTEKKLLKTNFLDLCAHGKKDLFNSLNSRGSKLLNKNDVSIELEFIPDDDIRWVKCDILFDFFSTNQGVNDHAVFLTDITMQKDTQRELEIAKEEAERTRLEQQQFLASMSHDIRTPLNAIIGMVLLMAETNLSKEQQEYFKVLKNASDILLDMLNSILNFAKIESGKQEVNNKEFDLPELLRALIGTFSFKVKDEKVDIHCDIDPAIEYYLIGDKVLLNQVLMNLLTNAKKFTRKGEIRLSAGLERTLDSTIWIRFRIEDTGIGISEENMKKIFQDFIKADDDVQLNYGGFGLGLFICKKLVELMGGKVILKSQEGKGTSFTFSLPFGRTNKRLTKVEVEEVPQYKPSNDIQGRLLVVEDNYMNLKYLSTLLEKYEIDFDVAMDGLEAMEKIKNKYYDLVLMDMKLPKMDGLKVTKTIRNEQNHNIATPIILVSAATTGDSLEESKKAGVNDLLPKPYTPQQLINILKKYLVDEDQNNRTQKVEEKGFRFNQKLDIDYLQKLYSGNCNYAMSLFEVFIEWADNDWSNVQKLTQEQDWKELKDLIHKIKPNFSMVGLTWTTELMQKCYDHLKEGNHEQAIDLLKRVQQDFEDNLPIVKEDYNRMHQYVLKKEFPD